MDELISGAIVRGHVDALRERLGGVAYDRVVASLSSEARGELLCPTILSWVHVRALEQLYAASAAELGTTVVELHSRIAGQVLGRAVGVLRRTVARLVSDEMLVSRSPSIFGRAYKQGQLDVLRVVPGACEVRITSWPDMSDFALRGFRLGVESTLRTHGRRDTQGSAERTPDGALLHFTWNGGR